VIGESRRTFLFAVVGLWQAASARAQLHSKANGRDPGLVFLTPAQHELLLRLIDRFVPADERSAGAVGAKLDEYIDFVLLHADPTMQSSWRKGLTNYAVHLKSKPAAEIDEFLATQARSEFSPETEDDRFFVLLKVAVTEGFYTSEEGIVKELGYKGMTHDMDAAGCTHAAHKIPADYKPLLRSAQQL
jgi:hypothetical protein